MSNTTSTEYLRQSYGAADYYPYKHGKAMNPSPQMPKSRKATRLKNLHSFLVANNEPEEAAKVMIRITEYEDEISNDKSLKEFSGKDYFEDFKDEEFLGNFRNKFIN